MLEFQKDKIRNDQNKLKNNAHIFASNLSQ